MIVTLFLNWKEKKGLLRHWWDREGGILMDTRAHRFITNLQKTSRCWSDIRLSSVFSFLEQNCECFFEWYVRLLYFYFSILKFINNFLKIQGIREKKWFPTYFFCFSKQKADLHTTSVLPMLKKKANLVWLNE